MWLTWNNNILYDITDWHKTNRNVGLWVLVCETLFFLAEVHISTTKIFHRNDHNTCFIYLKQVIPKFVDFKIWSFSWPFSCLIKAVGTMTEFVLRIVTIFAQVSRASKSIRYEFNVSWRHWHWKDGSGKSRCASNILLCIDNKVFSCGANKSVVYCILQLIVCRWCVLEWECCFFYNCIKHFLEIFCKKLLSLLQIY